MSKNNITRRGFIGAASLSALSLALTACGGSSDSGATADTATEAEYTLITPGKLTCVSDMAFPPMDYMEGDTYTGSWKSGKRHGQGTYTGIDGVTYEGAWANDKRHGLGVEKNAAGEVISEGEWKNNELRN
jgi:hypothetical protein